MDDYVKAHQDVPLFDEEWRNKQNANDPNVIKESLLNCFPDRKKHRRARVLVGIVCNRSLKAENSHIALRLWKDIKKSDYQRNNKKFLESIKNLCNKTVRPRIKTAGYTLSFNPSFTEFVKLK
jgi:hypothetical protein